MPGLLVAGKYRLDAVVGRGGSADVFRATDVGKGVLVALKLLRPDAGGRDLTRRFFEAATAVNRIAHPAVVRVDDAGYAETGPFLAMELVDGVSLAMLLDRGGRLAPPAAIEVATAVLDALAAAHRAGVVHLDLKPEHVLLQREGGAVRVRLLDFGLARRAGEPSVFGTAPYLSPEQACGEPTVDGRSDLFSLASMLFECIAGQPPFSAATAAATAYRIVHAPAPSLAEAGVPEWPALDAVLARALRKLPAERHADAPAFAADLARAVPPHGRAAALAAAIRAAAAEPASARPAPPPRPSSNLSVPVPRALPERPPVAPSRPQVRGALLRSLDVAVEQRFGAEGRARLVARLPDGWGDELRRRAVTQLGLYELHAFSTYADLALDLLLARDERAFRELGRDAVRGELARALDPVLRAEAPLSAVRRGAGLLRGIVGFGAWSTREEPSGTLSLRADELDPAPPSLRHWLVGAVEQSLWSAGWQKAQVRPVGDLARTRGLAIAVEPGLRTVA